MPVYELTSLTKIHTTSKSDIIFFERNSGIRILNPSLTLSYAVTKLCNPIFQILGLPLLMYFFKCRKIPKNEVKRGYDLATAQGRRPLKNFEKNNLIGTTSRLRHLKKIVFLNV